MGPSELDLSDLTAQAVDNLVTQFSSSLDFYRELIQNSIDAGSATVDVWMELIPGEEDQGTIAIHIDDSGEGMNEEIIDGQLTKLFSSKKEGDLTKIGKFGIGFVSVFACRPKAVLLHTGRDGEHWEICFDADRSFVKARLDTPVDGTQITLFLEGDRGRYGELVARSRETLRRWCAHSDVEVTFEDRSAPGGGELEVINEDFAVTGACLTRAEIEGTEIVAAFSQAPVYGFYNKGLALAFSRDGQQILGDRAGRFERIAFKVKSRYLEHTLSRDTVVQDANFLKVMRMVDELAAGPLLSALIADLTALVGQATWDLADAERYHLLLDYLARQPIAHLAAHGGAPLLRTIDGGARSLDALWEAAREDGRIYVSDVASPLTTALAAGGVPVLFGRRHAAGEGPAAASFGALGHLVVAYLAHRSASGLVGRARSVLGYDHWGAYAQLICAPEDALLVVEPIAAEASPSDAAALIADADALLQAVGAGYRRLIPCRLSQEREPPLFVVARAIQRVMAIPPPVAIAGVGRRLRRPEAAVNHDHPHLQALVKLRARDPAMAAYCLAKDLLLAEDRRLDLDGPLMAAALPGHARRFDAKEARR